MSGRSPHRLLDRVFAASLILKGIDAALELGGGVLLLFAAPDFVAQILSWASAHWMSGPAGPTSIGLWFEHLAESMNANATIFGAVYLTLHGVVKVVLVFGLLRKWMWAYPSAIAALSAFIAYQCYELIVHFTWWMLLLTLFDLAIVAMTAREWQLRSGQTPPPQRAVKRISDHGP